MTQSEKGVGVLLVFSASVSPLIFPISQAGYSSMAILGPEALVPSIGLFLLLVVWVRLQGMGALGNRVVAGAGAGILATAGLEVVRGISFHYGGMPGNLPELLGVLLTGRIMDGPSLQSDLFGWGYHFWNGLCFGVIYTIVLGRRKIWVGMVYATLIGLVFLMSPAVSAQGIGFMGIDMPSMILTVVGAHLVFGFILGLLGHRWVRIGEDSCSHPLSGSSDEAGIKWNGP